MRRDVARFNEFIDLWADVESYASNFSVALREVSIEARARARCPRALPADLLAEFAGLSRALAAAIAVLPAASAADTVVSAASSS
jgi:hypothetical protein